MHTHLTEHCRNQGFSMGSSVLLGSRLLRTFRRYHETEKDGLVLHSIVIHLLFRKGGTWILHPPQTHTCMCICTRVCAWASVAGWQLLVCGRRFCSPPCSWGWWIVSIPFAKVWRDMEGLKTKIFIFFQLNKETYCVTTACWKMKTVLSHLCGVK